MTEAVPPEFMLELIDDAMAPKAPKGARIKFRSTNRAEPGDAVLVRDARGTFHFREHRLKRDGGWTAHAYNPAYPSLDSTEDGLEIVAVFSGIDGSWSQLMR